jgi:Leucine-rich repeat (LRR) protein
MSVTNFNITGCTALQYLDCGNATITSLDVSTCTLLQELTCNGTFITSLDVSTCTALQILDCSFTDIEQAEANNISDAINLGAKLNNEGTLIIADQNIGALDVTTYPTWDILRNSPNPWTIL